MKASERIAAQRDRVVAALDALAADSTAVEAAADQLAATLRGGGRVLVAGNGGSAAEAQHLAGELIGRLAPDRERDPLAAIALTADAVGLTALANDYGYESVFARQIAGLGREGDTFVALSTSGGSANLVTAVGEAHRRGVATVGLLGGTPRALHEHCNVVVAVPAHDVQTIQECHLVLVHLLVAMVEDRLAQR